MVGVTNLVTRVFWVILVNIQNCRSLRTHFHSSVLQNIGRNHKISDSVKELGMQNFQMKLQHRQLTPETETTFLDTNVHKGERFQKKQVST